MEKNQEKKCINPDGGYYQKYLLCLLNHLKSYKKGHVSCQIIKSVKNVIYQFLLAGDKSLSEMNLRQPGSTHFA